MALARIIGAGKAVGDKLTSTELNAIDANIEGALDKRAAQTDTLSSTVSLAATGSVSAAANGSFIAATAAGAKIKTATGGRIELGDNDYPTLKAGHAGITVVRQVAVHGALISDALHSDSNLSIQVVSHDATNLVRTMSSAEFLTVNTGSSTTSLIVLASLDDYLVNGATLTSVDVYLYPGSLGPHSALPAWMPRVRVVRLGRGVGVENVLHSSGSSVVDTSANAAAYDGFHSIVATCDQNNVVDKTQFNYVVGVWNEGGTNALAQLTVFTPRVTMTIADLRPH